MYESRFVTPNEPQLPQHQTNTQSEVVAKDSSERHSPGPESPFRSTCHFLGVGAFPLRNYSGLQQKYGAGLRTIGILLPVLRCVIWVINVLIEIQTFCNAELLV